MVEETLDLVYTVPEAAKLLKMSESTLHRFMRRGELHPIRLGRKYTRIPREEILAFIERHKV